MPTEIITLPAENRLLTTAELSELSGVPVETLRYRARRGILLRADSGAKGKSALYALSEVVRMRDLPPPINEYQRKRAEFRQQIEESGQRPCLGSCGRTLPLDQFPLHSGGPAGRAARCFDCKRPMWRQYGNENREQCTRRRLDYDARNREKVRETRRNYTRRVYATNAPAKAAMIASRIRTRLRLVAIDTGKSSPICRQHGFSLVVNQQTGEWRPARLDKPIATGERAVCHYKYGVAGVCGWIVLAPPLFREQDERLIQALVNRERRINNRDKRTEKTERQKQKAQVA